MKQHIHRETKTHYWIEEPIFERHENVEVDDECVECGQKRGSHTESRGVNQIGSKWSKHKKDFNWYAQKIMIERLTKHIYTENELMKLIHEKKGQPINIKPYEQK